jgi:hypothetical protein
MFLGSYLGHETDSWLRLFVDFLSASSAALVPQIRLRPLPSKSFPIRYSLITRSFDPLVTGATSSVTKLTINKYMSLNGYREYFHKGKAKNIATISFQTSAKVRNTWSLISTSYIPLHTAVLKPLTWA